MAFGRSFTKRTNINNNNKRIIIIDVIIIDVVGVRRSCRALQFILAATEAAIATQKPNGKLNTAC